ncbi:50S ribosomal protein L11 methyltransferase [Paraurantiacibacter namhicola]|uniref:Ribosomal protein L11 methyltransferase n=1 Tax=Paraurantiacibacter namhicola TaxID=645517 RepID=A0A1C7D8M7_9SPHN|nr:50S ribosomal protein L11 methyltransferase [Paraurantiacibacter namhicola]ANU07808.1 Ribosomal protein L11 methyltransferase [Paraurantiacibacter namhicola]
MSGGWKLVAHAPRQQVEAALARQAEDEAWNPNVTLTGFEIAEDRPDDWVLEAYFAAKPDDAQRAAVAGLFAAPVPDIAAEELPDEDWLTVSQQGVDPIRAGRFHVHTPDHPALVAECIIDFCIPAAQAFGTGQHETTAGCLEMLDAMHHEGRRPHNVADIGTGTGLLGFGARALWPGSAVIMSDIDAVCEPVVAENAAMNGIVLGEGPEEVQMLIADGMDHPALVKRAPYDLLIANILAAPLVEMAADFASAVTEGGDIVLAGLLETQQPQVVDAYAAQGCRLEKCLVRGDWSILWLTKQTAS